MDELDSAITQTPLRVDAADPVAVRLHSGIVAKPEP